MYKKILVCLDNSDYSTTGIDLALAIANATGGSVAGCHVYAAGLHEMRFRQMEGGLPPRYQAPEELKRQREIHEELIGKGLRVISDSYMAVLEAKASASGIETVAVQREGRNYEEIVKEVDSGGYDLVVMGALGLGRVASSRIGSVAERVLRRVATDVLLVRDTSVDTDRAVVAAVDGSPSAFGALEGAQELARIFTCPLEAVAAFDPDFHHTAFRSISGVLTAEASKIFRFEEQEELHNEIIDKGLARIYDDHLDTALRAGERCGVRIKKTLLSGKAADRLISHAQETSPFILALGRTGVHSTPALDIGSVTENCIREAGCNVLVSSRLAALHQESSGGLLWSDAALKVLERIPEFARGVAKKIIEGAARDEGVPEITEAFMRKVRRGMEE